MKKVDPYGNVAKLDASGNPIPGAYDSQSWQCTDHENVLRQLEAIHDLELSHPWYRVALTPWHARRIDVDGDCGSGYWCDKGLDVSKNAQHQAQVREVSCAPGTVSQGRIGEALGLCSGARSPFGCTVPWRVADCRRASSTVSAYRTR